MVQYRIAATASTKATTNTRKGKCTAANVKTALLKLFQRYPQLEDSETIQIDISIDEEEDLT